MQKYPEWMNTRPAIQKLRQGKQPIGKDMIRDLLQNRVYTGRVPYAETRYAGSLGQGKRSNRYRKEWFEGKHQGFISDELFTICQEVRQDLKRIRRSPQVVRTYILHDRIFCLRCTVQKPAKLTDKNYGKMRPSWDPKREIGWYRCIARDRGYHRCKQPLMLTATADAQVVEELSKLSIPQGFRERVEEAIRNKVEHEEALKRMAEIEEMVKRIDFSWEKGFLTPKEYTEKRDQLQREIDSLIPVQYDDLMEAADLLKNFSVYWKACEGVGQPVEAQKQLLAKIVDRVFVYDDQVVAIALHGDYGIILDNAIAAPFDLMQQLEGQIKKGA